jgi:hypothetical protein
MMRNVSKTRRHISCSGTTKRFPPQLHDARTAHQRSAAGLCFQERPHPKSLPTDSDRQSLPRPGDGARCTPLPVSTSAAGPAMAAARVPPKLAAALAAAAPPPLLLSS